MEEIKGVFKVTLTNGAQFRVYKYTGPTGRYLQGSGKYNKRVSFPKNKKLYNEDLIQEFAIQTGLSIKSFEYVPQAMIKDVGL